MLDSGVGGLPYLAEARAALPGRRFDYLADRAGFPYGTKDPKAVVAAVVDAARRLAAVSHPEAMLIACNTATEHAIDSIREALPGLPVVGTVPAVKPAAGLPGVKRIGVIATPGAASSPYLRRLVDSFARGVEVSAIGDGALVEFVERRFLGSSREERLAAVRPGVERLLESGAEAIVLGCTHFVHLASEFAEAAGQGVAIVDSRAGVAARLAELIGRAPDSGPEGGADRFYLTGPEAPEPVYEGFARLFGLAMAGSLP